MSSTSSGSGRRLPDSLPATLARGASIGRYVVLGLVGRGGMGEVYGAYDPELDRKVAVKLLRVKPGNGVTPSEGRQRTLREAQAIARLSHPNVVVVYDVGTFADKVFIAMEFVEGNTATYWLGAEPRTWEEVLKVFIAAGRGLAAAHDKGLVHRDFKPDNVMVGRDGQARVMDFGLARHMPEKTPATRTPPKPIPIQGAIPLRALDSTARNDDTMVLNGGSGAGIPIDVQESGSGVLDLRLTRPGAMLGTPVYMAPEQFRSQPTDARTDQFSFCIALYEALYGERPFAGDALSTLSANVARGEVRQPPTNSRVPLWLRKILLRGLRPNPDDRWPSMEDLIAALGKNPTIKRRNLALAATGVVLAAAAAIGVRPIFADTRGKVCLAGPEKLAGIWDLPQPGAPEPARHAQIRTAFMRTGKSYAPDVFNTVSRALTGYARRWADMYKESCEATQIRGDQSAEVLDLRTTCLAERLNGLQALMSVFSDANGEVVENAVSAANSLGSLDRCADVPLLRAVLQPPEGSQTRARVAEMRVQLADVKARYDAGRWKEPLKTAPAMVVEARAVGYRPLLAETLSLVGLIYGRSGDISAAERTLVEAFWAADMSRHDEIRAEAATNLVFLVGYQQGRFAEAQRWATAATSVLQRMGGHELLQSWLLNDMGCAYHFQGDYTAAVNAYKEALALKEKVLGREHPDVGRSEGNLGMALHKQGRTQEALAHLDFSIALLEAGLGPGHPNLAAHLTNRGEVLSALGRYREARQSFERARSIWESELGPDNLNLAFALTGIGLAYVSEGNPNSALIPLERAFKIRESREKEPSRRAETSFALARALWESRRDRGRARALADAAREAYALSAGKASADEVARWLRDHNSI